MNSWSALGLVLAAAIGASGGLSTSSSANEGNSAQSGDAQKPSSSIDARVREIEAQMTDAERLQMLHSVFARPDRTGKPMPDGAIGSASFTPPIPRLGIPALQETDASLGVAWVNGLRKDGATALPASLSLAASWNPELAYEGSALVARESRAKGFNVLLAGGINLARDPRNGRNFEYLGEDPLLAGVLGGESIRAIQASPMISTIKHFAVNPQETGRHVVNSTISEAAAMESDLLAFRIAMDRGHPGAVMCAYNRYNGPQACQSPYLLQQVLKEDWKYPGFVMSDWGAVRSASDLLKGLDRQSGEEYDDRPYFAEDLPGLIESDPQYRPRVRDAVRRMLHSMFASGIVENPPQVQPIDVETGRAIARKAAAEGIVLLKNDGILPLLKSAKNVAIIGGYANAGVVSGGGSSQVQPEGGPALMLPAPGRNRQMMLHPGAPLDAITSRLPEGARVRYDQGFSPASAAKVAADADVAIVFGIKWMTEGLDAADLSLPQGQDAMIAAVAAANPKTIVVLESGGPVLMPWLDKVPAVVEAWFPGVAGSEAIADVLFGDVNPSGHLPITFPRSLAQLPRPVLDDTPDPARDAGSQSHDLKSFDVDYDIEGADVGYRWFARKGEKALFPFGHGLSYTSFAYSNLGVSGGDTLTVSFDISNTGKRAGSDVPQAYVQSRAGKGGLRLIGWERVTLAPGETRRVSFSVEPKILADWSVERRAWIVPAGAYAVAVGTSAEEMTLRGSANLRGRELK